MTWTRSDYVRNWPDAPNPYSLSDEPMRGGAMVDEARMLNAIAEHHRLMEKCKCDWDIDNEGRGVNTPPAGGCPSHPEDPEEDECRRPLLSKLEADREIGETVPREEV